MPNLTNEQVIASLESAYNAIDDNFNKLFAACTTDKQRDDVRAAYSGVDTAYWAAINAVFQTNDNVLQYLVADIKTTTKDLKAELKGLKDIVSAIKLATAVMTTALAIMALVAP